MIIEELLKTTNLMVAKDISRVHLQKTMNLNRLNLTYPFVSLLNWVRSNFLLFVPLIAFVLKKKN